MSKHCKWILGVLTTSALVSFHGQTLASGFALLEQNAASLRTAYAGTAAIAEDASTGFYNSAGLTRLGEEQIVFAAVGIIPYSTFKATRATPTLRTLRGRVIPNSIADIAPGKAVSRPTSIVPTVHYARRINDCWVFGFNVTSPFGLRTKYKNDSVVRYMLNRAELRTYNISPSLAFSFGNGLSLGAGVEFIHTIAKLDTRVGIGRIGNRRTGRFLNDGFLENTISRWALGGHIGALYEFTDCTRIGLQYRSGYNVNARGDSRLVFNAIPGLNINETQGVHAKLRLPSSVVLSGYHDITDQWAIMADIQWSQWKRFNKLVAYYDDNSSLTQNFNFRNTTRYALGTSYQFDDCWLGSLGFAFDKSAVRNNKSRTVIIPDSNRYWAAFGFRYQLQRCLALDVGYAHLFFNKASIKQGPPTWTRLPLQQSVKGRNKARADLLGIQLTWDLV